jgi:hypothetical protein
MDMSKKLKFEVSKGFVQWKQVSRKFWLSWLGKGPTLGS